MVKEIYFSNGKADYMKDILKKLYRENTLSKDEIVYILENSSDEDEKILFEYAQKTSRMYYENKVYMRGLIEFSNICRRNCLYCGLRRDNNKADRYRLSSEQIMKCCDEGYELGYRTFVLQSGEDAYYTTDKIVGMVKAIKEKYNDAAVTLSLGERDREEYQQFFDAGTDRYLLRHETANKELYNKLHPNMSYENRIRCLYDLKEIGFQVGGGFMVGLPEQTNEDLADDLLFLKKLNPDMIGIGPFISHSDTPCRNTSDGTVEETLVMLALTRLLVPHCLLPATTAMGTLHPKGRERALLAGGNVVMPNLSPTEVRPKYALYQNKICTGDAASHCRKCIEGRINSVGFKVDMSRGDSYIYNTACRI